VSICRIWKFRRNAARGSILAFYSFIHEGERLPFSQAFDKESETSARHRAEKSRARVIHRQLSRSAFGKKLTIRTDHRLFQLLQHTEERLSAGSGPEVSGLQDRSDAIRRSDGALRGSATTDRPDDLAAL